MLQKDEGRSGEVKAKDIDIKDLRTVIQEIIRKKSEGIDMSEASIVVAGGRGVKSKEGFDSLNELADVLGAALGASRGACDARSEEHTSELQSRGHLVCRLLLEK